ncbi:hypothetical protein [Actinacidiphila oryziradicis]|uniref:Uncharacterized protein n=1 Tax=Actinacidiphila oryziradicis TaxID=2571141 RepID=A0A4V5N075_9ACTN|nr:hypothetical protein [Actinacidiphila oryziradicis]TKA10929.1 hypothetical protein FCI23_15030 [Actinacidiphila oryziradicis]
MGIIPPYRPRDDRCGAMSYRRSGLSSLKLLSSVTSTALVVDGGMAGLRLRPAERWSAEGVHGPRTFHAVVVEDFSTPHHKPSASRAGSE